MTKKRQLWLLFQAHVLGNLDSLHNIAAYYASSYEDGVLPNSYYVKAYQYYKLGAEKGNSACQYDYGFMLLLGEVGVKNEELALHWIKKAADGGYPAAKYFLADYPL